MQVISGFLFGGDMNNYQFIKDLIQIKSYDLTQNKEIIEYLIQQFTPYSKEIITLKHNTSDRESLLIGVNTKLKDVQNAIILSGHIDTVVANEELYTTDPYTATEIDGKIYGLGAIDMKSFFATILNNIEQLKNFKKPIIVAITGDEETDFEGIQLISQKLQQLNIHADFTMVGEPTNLKVCTRSKSYYEYEITVTGKSCHSSMPQNGINANYISARILLLIEKLCGRFKDTTITANLLHGGKQANIVCDETKIIFDIRSYNLKYIDKIISRLTKKFKILEKQYKGCKIEMQRTMSAVLPLEKSTHKFIDQICAEFNLDESEFGAACEAGYFKGVSDEIFVFGVGDLGLAHKPNEFVNLAEFDTYNALFMNILNLAY